MLVCVKCGAAIEQGTAFCGRCGTPIPQGAGVNTGTPPPPQMPYSYPSAGATSAPGLVTRVTNILTKPKQEWSVIAGETTSVASLYSGYIMILAAIPVLASFVQMSVIGTVLFRVGMATGVVAMVVGYALALGGVYLAAFVIEKLAPSFQSQGDTLQALKLVAYAYTATWVAGVFNLLPIVGIIFVLAGAVYSIYLFYLGLPVMMKTPPDKVVIYMIVSAVVIFVISVVIGVVVGAITAAAYMGSRVIG